MFVCELVNLILSCVMFCSHGYNTVSFQLVNARRHFSFAGENVTDVLISYFHFALCLLIHSLPFQISGYAALLFTCIIAFNC